MTVRPSLTLEQYAAVSAQLDVGTPKEEALRAAGITEEAWESTQAAWLARMAEQSERGRFDLTERYTKLFAAQRKAAALRKGKERKPLKGPLPVPPTLTRPPVIVMDQLVRLGQRPGQRAYGAGPLPPVPPATGSAPVMAHAAPAPVPSGYAPISGMPPYAQSAPAVAPPPIQSHGPPPSVAGPPSYAPPSAPAAFAPRPAPSPVPQAAPQTPVAAQGPRLTVEQFASLRAELVLSPEASHKEIRERYKLDDGTWPLEERAWQQRFAADKPTFDRYLKHFQYMRALLAPR